MTLAPAGKRITVMGLGRFGGGAGVARWLAREGGRVTVTDRAAAEDLRGPIEQIRDLVNEGSVELHLGGHDTADFRGSDLVVVNPAVPTPWDNPFLQAAMESGVPVTTEIRLLIERLDRRRIIGVTGTAGKSTTAAMIHHILARGGHRAHLGGNIGGSLLTSLDEIRPDDWIVLELSSAMLYWLDRGVGFAEARGLSPHVAVLTNIEPNHLDWHGSFEHYAQCKEGIFAHQQDDGHQVRGDDFDQQRRKVPLLIPGDHNQRNAMMALTAVLRATEALPQDSVPHLADFPGLPHRLQRVAERDGLCFYDDSKSTTPRAAVLAVQSFHRPSRIHLIAGGYDKGVDLTPIAALSPRIAGLYTIGQTGETLAAAVDDPARAFACGTLPVAVRRARERMRSEDILLLSPGCASWDQFENYEQRGKAFVREIMDPH